MTTTRTDTVHRPLCPRPGWSVELSHSVTGVVIARCDGCGAVELRHGGADDE